MLAALISTGQKPTPFALDYIEPFAGPVRITPSGERCRGEDNHQQWAYGGYVTAEQVVELPYPEDDGPLYFCDVEGDPVMDDPGGEGFGVRATSLGRFDLDIIYPDGTQADIHVVSARHRDYEQARCIVSEEYFVDFIPPGHYTIRITFLEASKRTFVEINARMADRLWQESFCPQADWNTP